MAQPGLERCLALALLLHILLFLVVGTAPGGDAPAGGRRSGELTVFLPDAPRPRADEAEPATMPGLAPPMAAAIPPQPASAAGHAQAGSADEVVATVEPSIVIRAVAAAPVPGADAPSPPAPVALPLLVVRKAPVEAGQASSSWPSGRPALSMPAASAPAQPQPQPLADAVASAAASAAAPAASEPPAPRRVPMPLPQALPAPLAVPLPDAVALRQPAFTPLQVPVAPAPPLPPPPPPPIAPPPIAPPRPAPVPAPLKAPLPAPTPLPAPGFTPLEVPVATPPPIALPRPAPVPAPLKAPSPVPTPLPGPAFTPLDVPVTRPLPGSGAPGAAATRAAPSTSPAPQPAERGGAGGASNAGEGGGRINLDGSSQGSGGSAPPSAQGASAPLNLDLHGGVVGPGMGRTRSGLLAVLPAPVERDAKPRLESELEKAARQKCAQAYGQEHGLLALPLLARDAVTGQGCKW